MLSKDVINGIRYYCFNNLSEFYRRFKDEIPMCRSGFFNILASDTGSRVHIQALETLAKRLNIMDKDGGSSLMVKERAVYDLIKLVSRHVRRPTVTTLQELQEFLSDYRVILKS